MLGVVGLGAIVAGAWQVYAPAGWIVGGALAVTVAALGSRRPVPPAASPKPRGDK